MQLSKWPHIQQKRSAYRQRSTESNMCQYCEDQIGSKGHMSVFLPDGKLGKLHFSLEAPKLTHDNVSSLCPKIKFHLMQQIKIIGWSNVYCLFVFIGNTSLTSIEVKLWQNLFLKGIWWFYSHALALNTHTLTRTHVLLPTHTQASTHTYTHTYMCMHMFNTSN